MSKHIKDPKNTLDPRGLSIKENIYLYVKETVEKEISDDRGTPSLKCLYYTNDMS